MKKILTLPVIMLLCTSALYGKRSAPKDVPPIVHNGVKYIVHHFGVSIGKKQNGGYIEAVDAESNKRLWLLRIYKIKYIRYLEKDIQDIFITKIDIKGDTLIVRNEKGDTFTVDLNTRKVTPKKKVYRFK